MNAGGWPAGRGTGRPGAGGGPHWPVSAAAAGPGPRGRDSEALEMIASEQALLVGEAGPGCRESFGMARTRLGPEPESHPGDSAAGGPGRAWPRNLRLPGPVLGGKATRRCCIGALVQANQWHRP